VASTDNAVCTAAAGEQLGPTARRTARNQQRGRHALAHDVANGETQAAARQVLPVVEIAADLGCRDATRGQVPAVESRRFARKQVRLDLRGSRQFDAKLAPQEHVVAEQRELLDRSIEHHSQVMPAERLSQVVVRANPERFDRGVFRSVRCSQNDSDVETAFTDVLEDVEAIHS
jgi:hypothetical protein